MSTDTLQWAAIACLALAMLGKGYLRLENIAAGWGVLIALARTLLNYLKGSKP